MAILRKIYSAYEIVPHRFSPTHGRTSEMPLGISSSWVFRHVRNTTEMKKSDAPTSVSLILIPTIAHPNWSSSSLSRWVKYLPKRNSSDGDVLLRVLRSSTHRAPVEYGTVELRSTGTRTTGILTDDGSLIWSRSMMHLKVGYLYFLYQPSDLTQESVSYSSSQNERQEVYTEIPAGYL